MRKYPAPNMWSAVCAVVLVLSFHSKYSLAAAYRSRVEECLDTLIAHGTDRYGPVHTPMLVSILDVKTLTCPRNPKVLDEAWRVTRRERRNPAGSNLLMDLPLLETMVLFSETHGEARYAEFARGYITYVATNLVDEKGFFWWGWHRHYDVYEDIIAGHAGNHHEIHAIHSVNWDILWKANPRAVKREIEAIWKWHVIDKKTGEVNRHGDGVKGCDFSMSAVAFIEAFAFLFQKTGDRNWLNRALLLTDYYWKRRNRATNLFAERPNAGPTRFDGGSFTTNIPGLFCHSLLTAFERTRQTHFRDVAVAILKAYAKHGYDPEAQRFWER